MHRLRVGVFLEPWQVCSVRNEPSGVCRVQFVVGLPRVFSPREPSKRRVQEFCHNSLTTSMQTTPSVLCVLQRRLCVRRVHAWNNTRQGRVHWSAHGNADVQSVTLRTATSVRHHPMHVRSAQKERSSATGSARVFSEPSDVQHAPPSSTASSVPTKHTARSATRRHTSLTESAIVFEESRNTQRVTFPDASNAAPSEGRVTSVVMGSSD